MKRCTDCKSLLSNSSKVCSKCGSSQLEKGIYTDEPKQKVTYNKHSHLIIGKELENSIQSCPTCFAGVTTNILGCGECSFCGDELYGDGGSYYMDNIDTLWTMHLGNLGTNFIVAKGIEVWIIIFLPSELLTIL